MVIAVVIAVGVGLLIAWQTTLLAASTSRVPALVAALLVNAGGLLAGLAWAVATRRWAPVAVGAQGVWWLVAGGIGWLVLAGLASSAARLGVAAALAVVVAAQVGGGLILDVRAGAAVLGPRGLLGAVLVVAGAWLLATR